MGGGGGGDGAVQLFHYETVVMSEGSLYLAC